MRGQRASVSPPRLGYDPNARNIFLRVVASYSLGHGAVVSLLDVASSAIDDATIGADA